MKNVQVSKRAEALAKKSAQQNELANPKKEKHPQPENWQSTSHFRLFISHKSAKKEIAHRLKASLLSYAIEGFVAHDDIYPTRQWRTELERALYGMDALVAIHTIGFSKSTWGQQEIGFARGRGVKIISIKMGENPKGIISTIQALQARPIDDMASEINSILLGDATTRTSLQAAQRAMENSSKRHNKKKLRTIRNMAEDSLKEFNHIPQFSKDRTRAS